jgi:hypothetical protein
MPLGHAQGQVNINAEKKNAVVSKSIKIRKMHSVD